MAPLLLPESARAGERRRRKPSPLLSNERSPSSAAVAFDRIDFEGGEAQLRVAVSTISGGPSPSRMAGTGWDKDTLKPGDQITAIGHRISDGTYFLRLIKVVAPDGRELICYGDR
jgi:hypothetical protein